MKQYCLFYGKTCRVNGEGYLTVLSKKQGKKMQHYVAKSPVFRLLKEPVQAQML